MMLEENNLQENEWLQKLFAKRGKWALKYRKTIFCVDMKSTQLISEGMNSLLR